MAAGDRRRENERAPHQSVPRKKVQMAACTELVGGGGACPFELVYVQEKTAAWLQLVYRLQTDWTLSAGSETGLVAELQPWLETATSSAWPAAMVHPL